MQKLNLSIDLYSTHCAIFVNHMMMKLKTCLFTLKKQLYLLPTLIFPLHFVFFSHLSAHRTGRLSHSVLSRITQNRTQVKKRRGRQVADQKLKRK